MGSGGGDESGVDPAPTVSVCLSSFSYFGFEVHMKCFTRPADLFMFVCISKQCSAQPRCPYRVWYATLALYAGVKFRNASHGGRLCLINFVRIVMRHEETTWMMTDYYLFGG